MAEAVPLHAPLPEAGLDPRVYGDDDRLTPPAIGERMAADIPGARLEVIERAGHLVNIEQPERFTQDLIAFAEEL